MTIDSSNNLYVTDLGNHSIRKITPEGIVSTIAGNGTLGSQDDIYASRTPTSRFNTPTGITIDSLGNIYVCEYGNHTIRKLTPKTSTSSSGSVISVRYAVTTIAGSSGTPGTTNGTGSCAQFWYPYGIVVDPDGVLYVTSGHEIRKITLTTAASGSGSGSGSRSSSCAVTDNSIAIVTTLAGSTAGYTDGPGSSSKFRWPYHLSYFNGALYVADYNNNTIRKITIPLSTQSQSTTVTSTTVTPTICRPCPMFTSSPGGLSMCNHSIGYITNPTNAGNGFPYHSGLRRGYCINKLGITTYTTNPGDWGARSSFFSSLPGTPMQAWDTYNPPLRSRIDPVTWNTINYYENYTATSKLYLFPGWIAFGYIYEPNETITGTDRLRLDKSPYTALSTVRNQTHILIVLRENEITIDASGTPRIISNTPPTPFPLYICWNYDTTCNR